MIGLWRQDCRYVARGDTQYLKDISGDIILKNFDTTIESRTCSSVFVCAPFRADIEYDRYITTGCGRKQSEFDCVCSICASRRVALHQLLLPV
jgi:hypothetical protein